MPVPVWDCPDLGLMDEPQDTATVVSDDIWKKFDLDFPDPEMYYERTFDDGILPDLRYDKMTCLASRKIRHHDCMWAGLCISKEHNRTLPAQRNSQIQKKVMAGRSLLIPRHMSSSLNTQQILLQQCRTKSLESDGDSSRPETPLSSDSDTESEDEGPFFRHDQINIHEKLSECMSAAAITKAAPVSQVTGQQIRRRKVEEDSQCQVHRETNIRNTLSDHCYHLNQPIGKNLEYLGVQTPSDSVSKCLVDEPGCRGLRVRELGGRTPKYETEEEEIDVVTYEKPGRPAALPTYPSPADQQHFQLTVKTAFKEKPPGSRPRGRPPSNPARKRAAQSEPKPVKRARQRPYQRRTKVNTRCGSSSPSSKGGMSTTSRSSSDDELDTEKRSLHNNMERQRRIELRSAFEELRVLVPAVETKDKAPKVAILRQAAIYCDVLTHLSQIHMNAVSDLRWQQEKLRARLSHLRRSLAMTR